MQFFVQDSKVKRTKINVIVWLQTQRDLDNQDQKAMNNDESTLWAVCWMRNFFKILLVFLSQCMVACQAASAAAAGQIWQWVDKMVVLNLE